MNQIKLTPEVLEELKYHLADRIVDNMDVKELMRIAFDSYFDHFNQLSEVEFLNRAKNYWKDHFDEVIEEIKEFERCDFKKPIEDREASNIFIDINNTGGKY